MGLRNPIKKSRNQCQTVVVKKKPPNASGTYGFKGVLRHPSRLLRPGGASSVSDDVAAVDRGEARRVSCFLRSTEVGLPKRLRQGTLTLQNGQAEWSPFWSFRREALRLEFVPSKVEARPADRREPNVKKGGKAVDLITVPSFIVIRCVVLSGNVDLVVPGVDQQLVEGFFRSRIQQSLD